MGLESGTYINSLNASNPLGTDQKSTVDDHIRLLKSTIKATFPNVSGAVTATHTQLNSIPQPSAFGLTLLDDADNTTARTTLSAAKSGTNSDITSLNNPAIGAATATTQAANDNSTKVATTAYADRLKIATQVAPGTDGNLLTASGGAWTSAAPASSSIFTEDYDSGEQTVTAAGLLTLDTSTDLSSAPKLVVLKLRCKTADAGYAINDEILLNPSMNAQTSGGGQSVYYTGTTVFVRFSTAVYQIPHKTTGAPTNLLATSWRLLVRAYA